MIHPLAEESSDRTGRLRHIMAAHWLVGVLIPISLWHVVIWNLGR